MSYDHSDLEDFYEFDKLANQNASAPFLNAPPSQNNLTKSQDKSFFEDQQELEDQTISDNQSQSKNTVETSNQTNQNENNINENNNECLENTDSRISNSYSFFDKYSMNLLIVIFAIFIEFILLNKI